MTWIIHIGILLATFAFMEFMAWFTHKYVMHGIMWYFHKDHHVREPGFFERNDLFFLIFAAPSAYCWYSGLTAGGDFRVWIGAGISLYGLCYFLVHDVLIHQRFKWFKRTNNIYFTAIRKAHKVHHKYLDKEDGRCFGMLFVPLSYFREAKKAHSLKNSTS
ncbi:MAG: beta-carotene hydroxylase [Flavobacteriales bacterium]